MNFTRSKMENKFRILLPSLFLIFGTTTASNILFYFAQSTYSHRVAVWPLVQALADRGHNVTFLSPHPPMGQNSSKITEYTPRALAEFNFHLTNETVFELRLMGKESEVWKNVPRVANEICEVTISDPEIREWIDRSTFDLVIINSFWNECGLGVAYKFGAKFAIFSPTSFLMWWPDTFGHVPESSSIPDLDFSTPLPMNFLQRVYNTLRPLYWHFMVNQWTHIPLAEGMVRKLLDLPNMPGFSKLWKNTSLVLMNTHFSFEFARSLPPLYISVGGLHIKEMESSQAIETELSKFLENSGKNGFVYVSFGSLAKASAFPPQLLQMFRDVFESFGSTTQFVWSYDMERPEEMPKNVFTVKWAPQLAVLAHKNIRGFITHGGAMSMQEALHFGVPAILFPLFGDQDSNAAALERNGCGIKLEIRGLQKETLRQAISDILTNPGYRTRMKLISERYKDRPQPPLETAVWWIEYVLRHQDTSFLKPLSLTQAWYEIRLLDVWGFILVCAFLLLSVASSAIIMCYWHCLKPQKQQLSKRKKL